MTDWAERLVMTNRAVTEVLEPLIQEAKRSKACLYGFYFSDLIADVTYDEMAVARFRNNKDGTGHLARKAKAFFGMCHLIAVALSAKHDGAGGAHRIHVRLHPRDEDEIAEQAEDPRRLGYGKVRTYAAHDSYRRMVEDMERLVLAGTHSKEGAKAAKADQLMCGMGRIKAAITFVNKERRTVFDGDYDDDGQAA
jgi:hypothetical protein